MTEKIRKIKNVLWEEYIVGNKGCRIIICMLKIVIILEMSAFLADLCSRDYWLGSEKFLANDINAIVPIIAIVWGVIMIPIEFLLGQIEHRIYGIRLITFLVAQIGIGNALFLISSFCIQLVFIILSVMYTKPVLFTVVAWAQPLYAFSFFYLAMLSASYTAIKKRICEQSEEICAKTALKSSELKRNLQDLPISGQNKLLTEYAENYGEQYWLLIDMMKNMDYGRQEEVESLNKLLAENICPKLKGIVGRKTAFDLTKIMLAATDKETIKQITYQIFSENISADARMGILGALIHERQPEFYEYCNNMMAKLKDSDVEWGDRGKLLYRVLLWAIHQQIYVMSFVEKLRNDVFIDDLRKRIRDEVSWDNERLVNEFLLLSCFDFVIMTKSVTAEKLIANVLKNGGGEEKCVT